MEYKNLTVEVNENIGWLRMNRPEALNALNTETLSELESAIESLYEDDTVFVIVITGEGKAFVAGADIAEMKDMDANLPLWLSTLYQVCIARGDGEEANEYLEQYSSIARSIMIEKIKSKGRSFLTKMIEGSLCPPENENDD